MAMRGRGGRGNNSNRQPRLIVNRVYEQFKPMSEWRQEDDYTTLLVYLPGFQREYIKVTTEPLNTVRVRGERLVSENKWSRFQEDYRVPENCEMRGIRAKLDGGILTITMPRKVTNTPPPTPTTATPRVAAKTEEPARRTKQEEPKEKKPDNAQTTRLENTLPPPPPPNNTSTPLTTKTEEQPVKKTMPEETKEKKPDKPQTTTQVATKTEEQPVKGTMRDVLKEKKPEKPQTTPSLESTLPPSRKPESSSSPTKQQPSKSAPRAKEAEKFTTATLPRGALEHDVDKKPNVGEKMDLDKGKGKETTFEEETKRDVEGSKGKQNSSGGASGGFRADLKQVIVRGIVNEDRKLLVNVGVGVLIIAALGVHVSYTMGLIGKGK